MKILRLSISGLPNFKEPLSVDFVAQQRVDDDDMEQLYNVFSNIYTSQALSFIGINASGKTTILKAISFTIDMLGNESLNNIYSKEILDDLGDGQNVVFTVYFYHDNFIYKLNTVVQKAVFPMDGSERLIIVDEALWSKQICRVKTKKGIFDFKESDLSIRRDQNEQFLPDDVSIIISFNKKNDSKNGRGAGHRAAPFVYALQAVMPFSVIR